jgi:hypothetical protein
MPNTIFVSLVKNIYALSDITNAWRFTLIIYFQSRKSRCCVALVWFHQYLVTSDIVPECNLKKLYSTKIWLSDICVKRHLHEWHLYKVS